MQVISKMVLKTQFFQARLLYIITVLVWRWILKKYFTFFIFAVVAAGVFYLNLPSVDNEDVSQQICEHGVSVISFSSVNCAACDRQKKEIEKVELAMSNNAGFKRVDIAKDFVSADYYQVGIVPTIIVFNDGVEVERLTGVQSSEYLSEIINREMLKQKPCVKGEKNVCKC